jgi:hypothetical protein
VTGARALIQFSNSLINVIASEAKQSMAQQKERKSGLLRRKRSSQ